MAVVTGGPEPDDVHRALFRDLSERYGALQQYIAIALFDLWEPHLTADDMERVTQLDSLAIELGPYFHLTYGFRSEVGWDDAMLSVKVDNRRVTPESLDDWKDKKVLSNHRLKLTAHVPGGISLYRVEVSVQ